MGETLLKYPGTGWIKHPLHHRNILWIACFFSVFFTMVEVYSAPVSPAGPGTIVIAEPLLPWVDWVLEGYEHFNCPLQYSRRQSHLCAWPNSLALKLTNQGGVFSQKWKVYVPTEIPLPGSVNNWPQKVQHNGQPAIVLNQSGHPAIMLSAGDHEISGHFQWLRLPGKIILPPETGLLDLTLMGHAISHPRLDNNGTLWLVQQNPPSEIKTKNHLNVQTYRRFDDSTPMIAETRLQLHIAGSQRMERIAHVIPGGWMPYEINSPLPAQLEPSGALRLQAKAGVWDINIKATLPGPIEQLSWFGLDPPVHETKIQEYVTQRPAIEPKMEIWSFQPRPQIRVVRISGGVAIDPREAGVPPAWQQFQAYRMEPGASLSLQVMQKGSAGTGKAILHLERNLWLDFDGTGYTFSDRITGHAGQNYRLDAGSTLKLGSINNHGLPALITRHSDTEGVEFRRADIQIEARGRLETPTRTLPISGWKETFQDVATIVHLPPGYRLLGTSGVAQSNASWLNQWNLLDMFLVLLLTLASIRLWGILTGIWTGLTLLLCWHEPLAPHWLWLNALIAVALVHVWPEHSSIRWTQRYRLLSMVLLLIALLPFMALSFRDGLFPQISMGDPQAGHPSSMTLSAGQGAPQILRQKSSNHEYPPSSLVVSDAQSLSYIVEVEEEPGEQDDQITSSGQSVRLGYIPGTPIQTGPGVPDWFGRTVSLNWRTPVSEEQALRLWLIGPGFNLCWHLMSVFLAAGLLWRWSGLPLRIKMFHHQSVAIIFVLPVLGFLAMTSGSTEARAELPDPELLEQLRARLLKEPSCAPHCAHSPWMQLQIKHDTLELHMEIHAADVTAIPLPISRSNWIPQHVSLDDHPATVHGDPTGQLWIEVGAGVHSLLLSGDIDPRREISLPLPLKPNRVEADVPGWTLENLSETGIPGAELWLKPARMSSSDETLPIRPDTGLHPFLYLERKITLGTQWQISNRLMRRGVSAKPLRLPIPLWDSESVTSSGAEVINGELIVHLAPGQQQFQWNSMLETSEKIEMGLSAQANWSEHWTVEAGPMWHMTWHGLYPVQKTHKSGPWLPQWRVSPGDQVTLRIIQPDSVPGRFLTINHSQLTSRTGRSMHDHTLSLSLRSSRGGQHAIQLPENADVQMLLINGIEQPLPHEQPLMIPVHPGSQQVVVNWLQAHKGRQWWYENIPVRLEQDSVNARVEIQPRQDRWLLWLSGPGWGPSVIFWPLLLVMALVSYGLGRMDWTPLKSRHWFLLLLGFSQCPIISALAVVVWLFVLEARQRMDPHSMSALKFNAMQTGIGALSLLAAWMLIDGVQSGLLGQPDMHIAGAGSNAQHLIWYMDRSAPVLPQPVVISLPIWCYRLAMLLWALWLSFALLAWMQWGWRAFGHGAFWRARAKRTKR